MSLFNTIYNTVNTDLQNWANNTLAPYVSSVVSIVSGVGSSVWKVLMFLYNLLIGLIVAVYLLFSRKKFARQSVLMKPKWAELLLDEVAFIDRMFGGFIDGKILDSAIIGVLCYIGCTIFRFPNALLVSAVVGITNVIPFFGPIIGAVPSTLLILIEGALVRGFCSGAAAAGRQRHRPENSGRPHRPVQLLGAVYHHPVRRVVGRLWHGHRCAAVRGHL